jgi:hypothetical protein
MTTATDTRPAPGAYVRHVAHHCLGLIRPDADGCWADPDGGAVAVHWLTRSGGAACRLHRPPDGWYDLGCLRVISS